MTRWVHISDVQLVRRSKSATDNTGLAQRMVEQVAAEAPDFVINAGDHINGAVRDGVTERRDVARMWRLYHQVMGPLEAMCPVISVPGNHDQTTQAATSDEFCRQTHRAGKRAYYGRTIKGVHVVALDTMARRHEGGFEAGTRQAGWVARDLTRARAAACTVVVGHYPIFLRPRHCDNDTLRYDDVSGDEGVLLPMLLDGGVDLYLCGHHHVYERSRYRRLTQVICAANDMAFEGLMDLPANQHCQVLDERHCYVRFTLRGQSIRGESIDLKGDVIDAWTQRLNPRRGR